MMNQGELTSTLASVLANASDPAAVSEAITRISDDFGAALATISVQTAKIADLEAQNSALREQNMKLFLKVGGAPEKPEEPETQEKPSFAALFDENGNLK